MVNGVAENLEGEKDVKKDSNGGGSVAGGVVIDPAMADAIRHAGSAFSLVRPKTEPG